MPSLDVRGNIAAAEIAFYVPVAIFTLLLIFRYAFRRDAGWFWLFFFAAARLSEGALLIAGELSDPVQRNLFIASYIISFSAVGFLLLAVIGFIGQAGQSSYSEHSRISIIFRLCGLVVLAGLALSIAGGVLGSKVEGPQAQTGLTLRRVGTIIYTIMYVIIAFVHGVGWSYHYQMRSYRRRILLGVSIALLFIGVRIAYLVIATWSSSDIFGVRLSSNPTLARFNPVRGDWVPYLVMSLIMEYVGTLILLVFSTVLARRHGHY